MHRDAQNRYHWALVTTPDNFLAWKTSDRAGMFHHIPADGYGYFVRTTYPHTTVNPNMNPRYHLVINIIDDGGRDKWGQVRDPNF